MRTHRQSIFEEEQDVNRWLVSYADFITLLFAFFVVMYAISQVNEGKYKQLSDSLILAFETPFKSSQPIQIGEINRSDQVVAGDHLEKPETSEQEENGSLNSENFASTEEFKDLENGLQNSLGDLIEQGLAEINSDPNWININLRSSLLFPSGSADLSINASPLLEEVSKHLNSNEQLILVHGHTDNIPIKTPRYPSNWELSSARAVAVVRRLENLSVFSPRMSVEGHGEFQPVADNTDIEGRAKNRRVVISISRKSRLTKEQKSRQVSLPSNSSGENPAEKETEPEFKIIRLPDGGIIIRGADDDG